jgi:hypothetical protein
MTLKEDTINKRTRYVSIRGDEGFEIFANPPISDRHTWEGSDLDHVADGWDIVPLAEKHGEKPVRKKIGEMIKALAGGMVVTGLFCQGGRDPNDIRRQLNPNGMSLSHVWVGPYYPVFRHGHPATGDCLYCVVAGELIMGRKRLGPGSSFLLPKGHPYKYSGGPDGCELIEIRSGMGEGGSGMTFRETSLDAVQRVINTADEHREAWEHPKKIGDTAQRQTQRMSGK